MQMNKTRKIENVVTVPPLERRDEPEARRHCGAIAPGTSVGTCEAPPELPAGSVCSLESGAVLAELPPSPGTQGSWPRRGGKAEDPSRDVSVSSLSFLRGEIPHRSNPKYRASAFITCLF